MKKLVFIFLLLTSTALAEPVRLTILHFNDLHGHVENAAKLAAKIKEIRAENKRKGVETILLEGGDLISGTPTSLQFNGKAEFLFLSLIGTDAITLGNHDFDFGLSSLEKNISDTNAGASSANVIDETTQKTLYPPFIVTGNSPRVAIIGIAHPDTPRYSRKNSVKGLKFESQLKAAKRYLPEMLRSSDIQIALTHEGVHKDIALAKGVRELDAIIGGHDHVAPKEYCKEIDQRPVCQTPPNGRFLGRIDLTVDGDKVKKSEYSLIQLGDEKQDQLVKKEMAPYIRSANKEMGAVIGKATKGYKHDRSGRSELGTLICKILKDSTGADIAIINSGGIRTNLKKGKITIGGIFEILPFPNNVVVVEMTGSKITSLFEAARKNSRSLQEYGLSDIALSPDRIYKVATIDFLTDGGEEYKELINAKIVKNTNKYIKDIVIEYIKKEKRI